MLLWAKRCLLEFGDRARYGLPWNYITQLCNFSSYYDINNLIWRETVKLKLAVGMVFLLKDKWSIFSIKVYCSCSVKQVNVAILQNNLPYHRLRKLDCLAYKNLQYYIRLCVLLRYGRIVLLNQALSGI